MDDGGERRDIRKPSVMCASHLAARATSGIIHEEFHSTAFARAGGTFEMAQPRRIGLPPFHGPASSHSRGRSTGAAVDQPAPGAKDARAALPAPPRLAHPDRASLGGGRVQRRRLLAGRQSEGDRRHARRHAPPRYSRDTAEVQLRYRVSRHLRATDLLSISALSPLYLRCSSAVAALQLGCSSATARLQLGFLGCNSAVARQLIN